MKEEAFQALVLNQFNKLDDKFSKIDETLSRMDARFSKSDETFSKMDARFSKSDETFSKMDARFSKSDETFSKMDARFSKIDEKLDTIEASQLRMENKFDEKVGALSDAFETCNDRIDKLHAHLDERIDVMQTDISYLVGKTAQHDRNFIDLNRKAVK